MYYLHKNSKQLHSSVFKTSDRQDKYRGFDSTVTIIVSYHALDKTVSFITVPMGRV